MQATASAYIEASLSREFGVAWMARADGAGNEIADVTDAEIDAFSSRRDSVTAMQAELDRQFQGKYDRAPNQRELLSIHRIARAATPLASAGPWSCNARCRARCRSIAVEWLVPVAEVVLGLSCLRTVDRRNPRQDRRA